MIYLIAISFFVHFIILKEWTNFHARWCSRKRDFVWFVLKPLGFCPYCTAGQIALWWGVVYYTSVLKILGVTAIVILVVKFISERYEKD